MPSIVEAVREAKGDEAAQHIAHLKKGEMVVEAKKLPDGSSWLPEPLRTAGLKPAAPVELPDAGGEAKTPESASAVPETGAEIKSAREEPQELSSEVANVDLRDVEIDQHLVGADPRRAEVDDRAAAAE